MPDKEISSEKQEANPAQRVVAHLGVMQVERRSILPPPEEMERYEKLCPGITQRLLEQFQKQGEHRMELEKSVITSGIKNSARGQIFAFILSLTVIIMGFVLILFNKGTAGIVAIVSSLAALVGIFIYGSEAKKRERTEKSGQNQDA